jgi:hypothetical protein
LLLYAKLVPMKERMQVVAKRYFGGISAALQPSFLVHSAAFAACAKAIFLSVNLSASVCKFHANKALVHFLEFLN